MSEEANRNVESEAIHPLVAVPDDYPRDPFPSTLSGAQPKFSARLIDGRYVVGLTEDERLERYVFCSAWVEQLVGYFAKVRSLKPELSEDEVLQYIHTGIRGERGDLGEPELDWIMKNLRGRVVQ